MDNIIEIIDWVTGDMSGLAIPAHIPAFRERSAAFLTQAFLASGALEAGNEVAGITDLTEFAVGGTGAKLILTVSYARPTALPRHLFIKFSRDFSDRIRDSSRYMLAAEVRFASLSREPGFPIAVPACLFADYHAQSGTGILITERIFYGQNGIEPHYAKCLDQELPNPLEHYRALVTTLARLSGAHKGAKLPARAAELFPFDAAVAAKADLSPYNTQRLQNRAARYGDFAEKFPHMLPGNIRTREFIAKFREEITIFSEHESSIHEYLVSEPDFLALCHWNANIDNAWFWRNADGVLECGLLDWGRVGQMNIARTIYGSISGAEIKFWTDHIDELLAIFAEEYHRSGGPKIDVEKLRTHLNLVTATMGMSSLMDVPPIVQMEFPNLAEITGPTDPRFLANENARVMLHVMTLFLSRWETEDFGELLGKILSEELLFVNKKKQKHFVNSPPGELA